MSTSPWKRVVCLAGGVGGARLVDGLAQALSPEQLSTVVNTGDDFEHWGLSICPDLDTVMYTLSGLAHPGRGWGLERETFETLGMMKAYGAADWFSLGDRDLGTHLRRTQRLRHGAPLSTITPELFKALGVEHPVLPMSDAACPTFIDTEEHGVLSFQDWLVGHRGAPRVTEVQLRGAGAEAAPGVLEALEEAELIVLAPSNPYVSIDPILALAGVRDRVADTPVVALSPIVGGRAVKGPLAEMLPSLAGRKPSAGAVVDHYEGLVNAVVVESGDGPEVSGMPHLETATIMGGRADRTRLARELLAFAAQVLS